MVALDLSGNDEIDDEGAAMLLECLSNVERLLLDDCNISPGMKDKLRERGKHSRRRRGGRGGAIRPPIRFKTSKIRANGLFIWANSLDIWAHHCQNTVSVSVKTFFFFFFFFFFFWRTPSFGQKNRSNFGKDLFFFFFLENTSIWAEKTVSILTEKRNASSHFSGKSLLPPQIILSSYGHGGKEVGCDVEFV